MWLRFLPTSAVEDLRAELKHITQHRKRKVTAQRVNKEQPKPESERNCGASYCGDLVVFGQVSWNGITKEGESPVHLSSHPVYLHSQQESLSLGMLS